MLDWGAGKLEHYMKINGVNITINIPDILKYQYKSGASNALIYTDTGD